MVRHWAALSGGGALLFLVGLLLVPVDEPVGRALVGTPGLVLVSGGLAFLGGIDFLGPTIVLTVLALVAFRRPWGAARVAVCLGAGEVATRAIKLLVGRPRPEWALVEAGGYAFPSGHATSGAVLAVLLAWFASRHLKGRALVVPILVAAGLYAAAMAMSRVILGVHHLSDVVAGVGLGVALAAGLLAASVPVERAVRERLKERRRTGSP